jgi:hypothetical protein
MQVRDSYVAATDILRALGRAPWESGGPCESRFASISADNGTAPCNPRGRADTGHGNCIGMQQMLSDVEESHRLRRLHHRVAQRCIRGVVNRWTLRILAYAGVCWCVLACAGVCWRVLLCTPNLQGFEKMSDHSVQSLPSLPNQGPTDSSGLKLTAQGV